MDPKRILVWTGGDDRALAAAVGAVPGAVVETAADRAAVCRLMRAADGFVTSVARWDADFAAALAEAPRLDWVQVLNAGFDNMERLGVPSRVVVTTVGEVNGDVVAEHALLMLLMLRRRMTALLEAQRRRAWAFAELAPTLQTLKGAHVAVLGFGHIGRAFAALANACGARVTAVARSARREGAVQVEPLARLGAVLGAVDALVVTAPLNSETERVVDGAALGMLRRGAYLVNVSRGRIVDTDALLAALDAGVLAGAALDVTEPEPLPAAHPLWGRANVIVTPHVAGMGGGERVRRALTDLVVDNVRRYVSGEPVRNVAPIAYA